MHNILLNVQRNLAPFPKSMCRKIRLCVNFWVTESISINKYLYRFLGKIQKC